VEQSSLSSRISSIKSGHRSSGRAASSSKVRAPTDLGPSIPEEEEEEEIDGPMIVTRDNAAVSVVTDMEYNVMTEGTESIQLDTQSNGNNMGANLQDPQTQRNFNTTLKKLWRRVEMMKRTNHFASAHYRARHFWFWFVPISGSMFMAVVLSLAIVVDSSGGSRVGLALVTAFFSCVALGLNFLRSRLAWSSHAEVHRSAEVELGQVAFRLDTLGKYDGRGLTTGSHSVRTRANAIRDLYRIDVYLQAMQRCTPAIPQAINDVFYLLVSRLKGICVKYPNTVKMRSAYAFHDEDPNSDDPVPVEMQIDALDLLGREIENYVLYPLFMPNGKDVVSRTIDIFFSNSEEQSDGGSRGGGSRRDIRDQGDRHSLDSQSYPSYDDQYEDQYEELSTVV